MLESFKLVERTTFCSACWLLNFVIFLIDWEMTLRFAADRRAGDSTRNEFEINHYETQI